MPRLVKAFPLDDNTGYKGLLTDILIFAFTSAIGLRALSTRVVSTHLIYLRWLRMQHVKPRNIMGLDALLKLESASTVRKLEQFAKSDTNRALVVMEGPLGSGKAFALYDFIYRLSHSRINRFIPFTRTYHLYTGARIPCVLIKLKTAQNPWTAVYTALEGDYLKIAPLVIRKVLKKMQWIRYKPVIIIDEMEQLFMAKGNLSLLHQSFIYFWQAAAEEGLATVILVTDELCHYWHLRKLQSLDSTSRVQLLSVKPPSAENISKYLESTEIKLRVQMKRGRVFTPSEIWGYIGKVGDYRSIEGYFSIEQNLNNLHKYIESLVEYKEFEISTWLDSCAHDKHKILQALHIMFNKSYLIKTEENFEVVDKLVEADIFKRVYFRRYAWHMPLVREAVGVMFGRDGV